MVSLLAGEKKAEKKSPRIYQAGLAICVIIIIILGGLYGIYYATYQSELSQIDSLNNQVNSLTADKNSLTAQVNSLTADKNALIGQITSLQSQIGDLKNQVNSLTANVNNLQSKYKDLNDTVYMKKSAVLDKDKAINILAMGHQTLPYTTAYAGYIIVDFKSPVTIYFLVGSALAGGWYAQYTSYGAVTNGRLMVPVFPGTTNLDIRNADPIAGVTVTITVTYIY